MKRGSQEFLRQVGGNPDSDSKVLSIMAGGTVCTDVSQMGLHAGLLGDSCRSLAIFLSEILHVKPKLVFHECTSRFMREVFSTYLPDYEINTFQPPPQAGSTTS